MIGDKEFVDSLREEFGRCYNIKLQNVIDGLHGERKQWLAVCVMLNMPYGYEHSKTVYADMGVGKLISDYIAKCD